MTIATLRHLRRDHTQSANAELPPSWLGVVVIVLSVVVVALAGEAVTTTMMGWYRDVPKPVWTPPDWVFAPVWGQLYTLMAVAASLVWLARKDDDMCCPLGAFAIQLILSLAWSVCFFGLRSPLLGFIDVCFLWVASGVTMTQFFVVSRPAGCLMVPVWLWITFAGVLNASIVMLGG